MTNLSVPERRIPSILALLAGLLVVNSQASTPTIWSGPNTVFTQSGGNSDTIVAGKVVLTRGANEVLYNTAAGEGSAGSSSPLDCMWAFGSIANYSTLTYKTMASLRNGDLAAVILNKPMVLHLVNENIYLPIEFTAWGQHFAGGFSYTRATSTPVTQPTVTFTAPANGAVYAAPAVVPLSASTTGGPVGSVQFFNHSTLLGTATSSPFTYTQTFAAPGTFVLTAVATAGSLTATSGVVNLTVIAPPTVTITAPAAGTVYAAPANVRLQATTGGGGSATNVQYFAGSTLLGGASGSPFSVTGTLAAAGSYPLTAVVTSSGIMRTSAVVNVSVVTPAPITLTVPAIAGGLCSFSYTTTPGLSYVVQTSPDLTNWTAQATNVAAGAAGSFSESLLTAPSHYYQVELLPNP